MSETATGGQVIEAAAGGRLNVSWAQLRTVLALLAAAALAVGLILWAMQPVYVPLASGPDRPPVDEVSAVLQSEGIPFRIDPDSGLVLVPQADLGRARSALFGAGLSGDAAREWLEDSGLGSSQFMQSARYHRMLESELARTISAMRSVESARVHLALPPQTGFVRRRQPASASVMVQLRPGRALSEEQVASIVHLVATSVPNLDEERITVVDQFGRLLSARLADPALRIGQEQLAYTRRLEQDLAERIEALLTPVVGFGRVRAQVTAQLDFSREERVEERYEPDPAQLRSEQIEERRGPSAAAGGVPGALSNQPPPAATLAAPGEAEGAPQAGEGAAAGPSERSVLRNYELDKTVRRVEGGRGRILRLSAAVVVDGTDPASGEPYGAEQLARFEALVKEAIGFDAQRGDSVTVFAGAFQSPEEEAAETEPPFWSNIDWSNLLRQLAAGALVLFLVFGVIRPALRQPKGGGAKPEGDDGGAPRLPAKGAQGALPAPPKVYGDILLLARELAREDPKRVAKVIKDWVGDGG
ncbi:MAG: flagellar M-ring protein [Gammaproteobacteria bacterium]|nr:MAG: flagellar M-ring protein [Gammaproteobacteria bacterium]